MCDLAYNTVFLKFFTFIFAVFPKILCFYEVHAQMYNGQIDFHQIVHIHSLGRRSDVWIAIQIG